MNRFEKWFIKRIIAKEVRQGSLHEKNIVNLYQMIRDACVKEFFEDNTPTISDFLSDCFESTQKWPFGKPKDKSIVAALK